MTKCLLPPERIRPDDGVDKVTPVSTDKGVHRERIQCKLSAEIFAQNPPGNAKLLPAIVHRTPRVSTACTLHTDTRVLVGIWAVRVLVEPSPDETYLLARFDPWVAVNTTIANF